jgi:hypothetical protein
MKSRYQYKGLMQLGKDRTKHNVTDPYNAEANMRAKGY